MAFDDILGERKNNKIEVDKDSLIKALEDNVKAKQKMIEDLIRQVTELERQIENKEQIYV